jgi:hypothetical protein
MTDENIKERGAASVFIELTGGIITVKHGTDDAVLAQWVANTGDWDKLWQTINQLKTLGDAVPEAAR